MKRHFIWFLAIQFLPTLLHAQDLRRCVRDDGSLVFTDKSCSETEIEKPVIQDLPITQQGKKVYPQPESCSHTTDELLYGVRTAINQQNVNQLAKYYHWVDLSSEQAENILTRLERVAIKPLVDIRIVHAEEYNATTEIPEIDFDAEGLIPEPQSTPIALKVIQYQTNSSELESTQFKLKRHFNCWWLRY